MFHDVAHYSSQKEPQHIGLPNLSVKVSQNEQCCPSIPPFSAFLLARLAAGSSQLFWSAVVKTELSSDSRRVFADLAGDRIRSEILRVTLLLYQLIFYFCRSAYDRNRQKSATFDNC